MAALTAVAIGLAVASTVATMYATDTAAKQEASNLKYQAAQTAADAKAAQGEAQVEAERIRKAGQRQQAQTTAAAAAAGVDVSSPTAIRLDEEVGKNAEEDALLTILNGKDRMNRMNNQAKVYKNGASMARTNATAANFGTLLSGASKVVNIGWKTSG